MSRKVIPYYRQLYSLSKDKFVYLLWEAGVYTEKRFEMSDVGHCIGVNR